MPFRCCSGKQSFYLMPSNTLHYNPLYLSTHLSPAERTGLSCQSRAELNRCQQDVLLANVAAYVLKWMFSEARYWPEHRGIRFKSTLCFRSCAVQTSSSLRIVPCRVLIDGPLTN